MLNLPRHVKVYLKNNIYSIEEGNKEVKTLIDEFNCKNDDEQRAYIYSNIYMKNSQIPYSSFSIEVEKLPIPEQNDKDIYEVLENCVSCTISEGCMEDDEYHFIMDWLKKHFNIEGEE